ncbi:MAG TPA: diguanylate cyclase [Gaiellaceae bacterium]|nr:diguanylate cyclase [Gaiellaceae bacterium]
MGSFKVRLTAYFALIALLPFAAAFQGFHSLSKRSETRRVDGVLQAGLRASLAGYAQELDTAHRAARQLAAERDVQRALASGDRPYLAQLVREHPDVRVETRGGVRIGRAAEAAGAERVAVVAGARPLGTVVVSLPLDARLVQRLKVRAGLARDHRLVFLNDGAIIAGNGAGAHPDIRSGRPKTVSVRDRRYRVLASQVLPNPEGVRLALLLPQGAIDRAASSTERRLEITMLLALILLILVAYYEGRNIVRTLARLADAAHDIARGRLDRRVPVRGRDEFSGLGRAFNDMADQLQARLRELDEERRRLREATMRFGEALAATHDVDGLLRAIVETAVESTGAKGGLLIGETGEIFRMGEPIEGRETIEFELTAGREKFGNLILFGDEFSPEARETADWLVGHGVIALENARLHRTVQRQALVDSLTGLANRRLCEAALEKEMARAQRFSEPLALILADLDNFKATNDAYGHAAGDEVLREFARTLQDSIREIDLAGRWGGEEFIVILPGTDLAGGKKLAERIRAELATRVAVSPTGERMMTTASLGVADYHGTGAPQQILAAADAALYEAKRTGKNRVVAAGESSVGAFTVSGEDVA